MDREGVVIQTIHRWKESAGVPSGQQPQPSRTKPERTAENGYITAKQGNMTADEHAPRTEGVDNIHDLERPTGNTRLLAEVTP